MAYIGNAPGSIRQGRRAVYEYTSTANQTAFSGVDDNGLTLDLLQANDNDVYLNGVRLIITDDYTISGDVLTLVSGAAAGDKLIVMTQDEIANDASYSKAASDSRYINYDGDIVNGTIQMGGSGNNITFADNNKAMFGDDNDLQIYHSGTTSFIRDMGDGDLQLFANDDVFIRGQSTNNYMARFAETGAVTLYHNNSSKFSTTSSGIDVTGRAIADEINLDGGGDIHSTNDTGYVGIAGGTNSNVGANALFYGGSHSSLAGVTKFRSGSATNITILSDGKVGIGTTTPSSASNVLLTIGNTSLTYAGLSLMAGTNAEEWRLYSTFDGSNNAQFGVFRPASNDYKFIINESGNVGVGTSAPSTKLEVAGTTKAEQYLLDAIAKDISDTAVDVFIYDTRKDSDGGAWRKRTQHTSWYNETLNTATRGSRKEFPAVAVIVLESGGSTEGTSVDFTIYDGDDPDMPMWMQYRFVIGSGNNTGISALNGIITFGATDNGVLISDFVKDRMRLHNHVHRHTYGSIAPGRLGRSTVADVLEASVTGYSIVNQTVNDVAMTVLPNAPIDSATGLPVPTIAVATNGGVSVIKDDGTVVDITESANNTDVTANVEFLDNGQLVFRSDGNTDFKWIGRINLPENDINYSYVDESKMPYIMYSGGAGTARLMLTPPYPGDASTATTAFTSYKDNVIAGTIKGFGQGTTDPTVDNTYNGNLVNYTSSSYNTGWMNGDIKLATLSDTDDTNLNPSELVTNGTFNSDVSGWSNNATEILTWNSSGYAQVNRNGGSSQGQCYQNITTEVGKDYVISVNIIAVSHGFQVYAALDSIPSSSGGTVANTTGTFYWWFTASSTTTRIDLSAVQSSSGTASFDDVSVKLAVNDRSVNNKGLQVFGTVTKSAVATGADLVAYSGFSSSNYLEQPANTDLDFGTGDFSFTTWFKSTSAGGAQYFYKRGENTGGSAGMTIWTAADLQYIALYINGSGISTPSSSYSLGIWNQLVIARRNGDLTFYINGRVIHSAGLSGSVPTGMNTQVGYSATTSHLSLSRISATAPSAEQIKKIYDDEKFLFQENAKATLYGSSDAITALAYDDDTELLHVGTSAGRSVFQGLRRIDNTTDAVGAAISASNGMVAED